jgi:hypothetical protein
MSNIVTGEESCADCICRVCAHNEDNDAWGDCIKDCVPCADCFVGYEYYDNELDCFEFLPGEDEV